MYATQLTFEGFEEATETELTHYLHIKYKHLRECMNNGGWYGEHIKAMLESSDKKKRIEGLKEYWGIGGGTYYLADGTRGIENHDSKGINIYRGHWEKPMYTYTYSQVDDALQTMRGAIR